MLQWPNDLRYAQSCSVQVPCSLAYSVAQSSAHDMARRALGLVGRLPRCLGTNKGELRGLSA